jgi:hypothetical protein
MDEFFEALTGGAVWGAAFGLVAAALGGFGRGMRPTAKNIVKGGLVIGDWFRETTAEGRETLQDIYAEAKAELSAQQAARAQELQRAHEQQHPAEHA